MNKLWCVQVQIFFPMLAEFEVCCIGLIRSSPLRVKLL